MIIVAVIGILAAAVTPKWGSMLRNSKEADAKSKLGIIRSALNIYYADNQAKFPVGSSGTNQTTLADTLVPKYLKSVPECYVYPYHQKASTVDNTPSSDFQTADSSCDGEWAYVSNANDTNWGLVAIECYHQDSKGRVWSTY